jgi:predicted RNA-binding protein YlxR (DUF448 family)
MSSFVSRVSESQSICVDMTISIRIYKIHSYSKGIMSDSKHTQRFSSKHDNILLDLAKKFNRKWKTISVAFCAIFDDADFTYEHIAHRGNYLCRKKQSCRKQTQKVYIEPREWIQRELDWLEAYEADWRRRIKHMKRKQHDWNQAIRDFKAEFGYERSQQSMENKLFKLRLSRSSSNAKFVRVATNDFTDKQDQFLLELMEQFKAQQFKGKWKSISTAFCAKYTESNFSYTKIKNRGAYLKRPRQKAQELEQPSVQQKAQESEQPSVSDSSLEELEELDNCLPADHCFTTVESMRNLGSDILLEDLYDLGDDPFSGL